MATAASAQRLVAYQRDSVVFCASSFLSTSTPLIKKRKKQTCPAFAIDAGFKLLPQEADIDIETARSDTELPQTDSEGSQPMSEILKKKEQE